MNRALIADVSVIYVIYIYVERKREQMVSLRQQPKMIVHQKYPLNAGPSLDLLRAEYITPQEHFFVRTHGTIPEVDSMSYRLVISGKVQHQLELSLDELRNDF